MTTDTKPARKPLLPWFLAMFASFGALFLLFELVDIQSRLVANAIFFIPMAFLVKAGMNASHNAALQGPRGNAARNYMKRMVVVSVTYVGSLFAASSLIDEGDPVTPLSIIIAVVPGIAVAGYFWAMGKFMLEQKDEFMRMLMVRQTLVATAFAFSLASVYGFLENFGQVPHIDAFWWPTAFFFGLGIGAIVNKLTMGTAGECA